MRQITALLVLMFVVGVAFLCGYGVLTMLKGVAGRRADVRAARADATRARRVLDDIEATTQQGRVLGDPTGTLNVIHNLVEKYKEEK